jgi:hypothetical protein
MDGFFVGVRSGVPGWDLERLVDLVAAGMYAHARQRAEVMT